MASKRALLYNNLSVGLEAGFPILHSFNIAASGMKGSLATAFRSVGKALFAGDSLEVAMSRHPRSFSPIDMLIVEAGDTSGNLTECLKLLSHWYAFCDRLWHTLLSGMSLPFILIHIAAVLYPASALFLGHINFSQYIFRVLATLALFYVPTAIIFAVIHLTPKTGCLRRRLDRFTLKIPVVGQAVRQLAISRYCSIFHMLFKGGLPITQCAQKASEHTGNVLISEMFAGGAASAHAGHSVSEGFSPKLPLEFIERWQIGEVTGELDNVVQHLAEIYAEISENLFRELSKWIPKLVYCLVCINIIMNIFKNAAMLR